MSKWKKLRYFMELQSRIVVPTYGLGEKKHDYGKGFYLTDNSGILQRNGLFVNLMMKMAGFINMNWIPTELKILDLQEKDVLSWLAELMKHRDASDSKTLPGVIKKIY